MKCVVAKHINDISLNDFEYLLDALDDEIRVFDNKDQAKKHLGQHGLSEDDMYSLKFFDYEKLQHGEFEEVA